MPVNQPLNGQDIYNLAQTCVAKAIACDLALVSRDVPALMRASEHLSASAMTLNGIAKNLPDAMPRMPEPKTTKCAFDIIAHALNMLHTRAISDDDLYRAELAKLIDEAQAELNRANA